MFYEPVDLTRQRRARPPGSRGPRRHHRVATYANPSRKAIVRPDTGQAWHYRASEQGPPAPPDHQRSHDPGDGGDRVPHTDCLLLHLPVPDRHGPSRRRQQHPARRHHPHLLQPLQQHRRHRSRPPRGKHPTNRRSPGGHIDPDRARHLPPHEAGTKLSRGPGPGRGPSAGTHTNHSPPEPTQRTRTPWPSPLDPLAEGDDRGSRTERKCREQCQRQQINSKSTAAPISLSEGEPT